MFVVDPQTSECLHYESITGYPSTKIAEIPREILTEHPEVEIRNDLIDCAIDVCSVEVCTPVMSVSFCTKGLNRLDVGAIAFSRQFRLSRYPT